MVNSIQNNDGEQFWIENIRNGDERAFEILFKKYYSPLSRFAWRYVNSEAIAVELVQEIFADIWENRAEWYITGALRPYLYKTVKNRCLNYLKHEKIRDKYDKMWMDQKDYTTIEIRDEEREKEIHEAIQKAIEELPQRSKMTYKLHRFDGLTYQEIAEVMDISVKTVESQMTRTLKILRKRLSYLLPVLVAALIRM